MSSLYISNSLNRLADPSQSNGGEVLPIEKHADVKIVDHARKEALPGTYVPPHYLHLILGIF